MIFFPFSFIKNEKGRTDGLGQQEEQILKNVKFPAASTTLVQLQHVGQRRGRRRGVGFLDV